MCYRPVWDHSAIKTYLRDSIIKLSPIHDPVIYQIPWIHWVHWIPVLFRENSIGLHSCKIWFIFVTILQHWRNSIHLHVFNVQISLQVIDLVHPWPENWNIYCPQTKFWEGKVFTSMCQSFCPRVGWGSAFPQCHEQTDPHCRQNTPLIDNSPPYWQTWDTVNKREVRILLECILVVEKIEWIITTNLTLRNSLRFMKRKKQSCMA